MLELLRDLLAHQPAFVEEGDHLLEAQGVVRVRIANDGTTSLPTLLVGQTDDRDLRDLRMLDQEHKRLDDRLSDLDQTLNGIEEQLDLCFESGKEDLARSLVRRKLENRQFRKHLAAQRKIMEQSRHDLSARLDENRTRLEGVRQKAEVLTAESTASHAGYRRDSTVECTVREEDVDIAFLREQQKRCQL